MSPVDPAELEPAAPEEAVAATRAAAPPSTFGTLFKRAFSADLDPGRRLPDEQRAIDVERIHGGSAPLERVLLWRRGALLVALVFLLPSTLVHLIRDFIGLAGDGVAGQVAGLTLVGTLAGVGLCIGAWIAYARWDHWARSRRALFWTWLIAFITPFLIALIPYGVFAGGRQESLAMGVIGGMSVVLTLAPKALSLIPGLLRAALTTKAVFPGTGSPGWLILLATPFYMLLLFVVMLMPYQFAGGGLMALALFCFLGAPIFLLRAGRKLSEPGALEPTLHVIRSTRLASSLLNGAGGLFLFIGLIDLVSTMKLSPLDAVAPIFAIIANVFVLGVVGVDTMLVALIRSHTPVESPEQARARAHHARELETFIVAQAEAQPDVVAPIRHIDYDQPTEPGIRPPPRR